MNKDRLLSKNTVPRILMFFVLITSCLMVSLLAAKPTYAKTYKVRTASDWKNISKYKGGKFKLTKDIKLKSTKQYLTISKNKKYVIDLNGHKVMTTYSGVALRVACPLYITKGTVILKNSKKNGLFYSTETASVLVSGAARFYLRNCTVVNNATEFRSDITSAIMATGSSRCYIENGSAIQSIGNGVALQDKAALYCTGNPYVRAGANEYKGKFTHYGNGIVAMTAGCTISLHGGSYGTKATPDIVNGRADTGGWYVYPQSANYPILDVSGSVLKNQPGYKFVDSKGEEMPILPSTIGMLYPMLAGIGEKKVETWTTDANGYYTIYVIPA